MRDYYFIRGSLHSILKTAFRFSLPEHERKTMSSRSDFDADSMVRKTWSWRRLFPDNTLRGRQKSKKMRSHPPALVFVCDTIYIPRSMLNNKSAGEIKVSFGTSTTCKRDSRDCLVLACRRGVAFTKMLIPWNLHKTNIEYGKLIQS